MTAASLIPTPGGGVAAHEGSAAPTTRSSPRVLGLDLSLSCTGLAGPGWTDTIEPKPALRGHPRMRWIREQIVDRYLTGVRLVVVEGPAYGSQRAGIQRGHHERAGLWWLITHMLWRDEVPFAVIDPTTLKRYATGKGNANKAAMLLAAARRFPWFDGGDDEADALWLAAAGAEWLGEPMADVPKAQREALSGCDWPVAGFGGAA